MSDKSIKIIGAGLAGSEAALTLSKLGVKVRLFEMRPFKQTQAHRTEKFAEFVCSNSLGAKKETNASGLLKKELLMMKSSLIEEAFNNQLEAGEALAIDREQFSLRITNLIENDKNIEVSREEVLKIDPDEITIIASGPLTSDGLVGEILKLTEEKHLYFFDAIAPVVEKESINFDIAFLQNRYDKGEACYINCPMNEKQYREFYNFLINAPVNEVKDFEKDMKYFEGCMPIEALAKRGFDTLRFGPLKPVGLVDKRTGEKNFAVVQLRQDNFAKTLYNLVGFQTNIKWKEQKQLIRMISGLENASVVKLGTMHKNIFINSPRLLNKTLNLRKYKNIFFAGQITGTEGYTESIAMGHIAALNAYKLFKNEPMFDFPKETISGALCEYISFEGHKKFQPTNSNWALLPSLELPKAIIKHKPEKAKRLAQRSCLAMESFLAKNNL